MNNSCWFEKVICRLKDDYLSIRVFGEGKKILLAFHGYGQSGDVYKIFASKSEYKVYAFDLFFHGESSHPNTDQPLDHQYFRLFMENFFQKTGITKFEVTGFSMGGKYALSLLKSFPEAIDKITLVAPDGVEKNFWYSVATGSRLTRKIFNYMAHHPGSFFKTALVLEKTGIIDGRVRKFALSQMDTFEKRKRVYSSWVYLRKLFVPKDEIAKTITSHGTDIEIVIGKYDRIIPGKSMQKLLNLIGQDKLRVINSGHSNILKNYLSTLSGDENRS